MMSSALISDASSLSSLPSFANVNSWVMEDGREFVAIEGLEQFEPFFLSLASVSNQWLFCSSNGPLSAGRENAERALFPYLTVDQILGNWNMTGPQTAISCEGELWHPFWPTSTHRAPVRRRLLKSLLGEELVFEEFHEDLQLRFRYRWQLSERYGFVRKVAISNEGSDARTLRIIDGLQDLQAPGVGKRLHLELSCLADAYKMSEVVNGGRLMVHRLASGIVDAPIPLESLRATTVWSTGFKEASIYLSRREANGFLEAGAANTARSSVRGERGAFFLGGELTLEPGRTEEWMMVAEIEQSHREVADLIAALNDEASLVNSVEMDLRKARTRLRELADSVDGFQLTADRDTALYHYHNTLCNFLRGGLPEEGTVLSRDRLQDFLVQNNREIADSFAKWLEDLPGSFERDWVISKARETGDLDLIRLVSEYLPLILGRRHGDPSRPWNKFNIRLHDEDGRTIHHYEGNWRDIFQNWEALAWSYPGFLGGFVSRFLNASTIDGFNPYRVTSAGVDWEVPDADDPWVSIGYWGDHQIIYLLKFLELQEKLDPGFLEQGKNQRPYVFADVPYVLAGWEKTLLDPRDTVTFDEERHERLLRLKDQIGGDGLLLRDDAGELVRAGLLEKLLIPALAKLGQLVPDGGIWMNTQKPEWNDANNALAGNGLSVVTTAYLLRYFRFLKKSLEQTGLDGFTVSDSIRTAVTGFKRALSDERWDGNFTRSGRDRFDLTRVNVSLMERYRSEVLQGTGQVGELSVVDLREFIEAAERALEGVLLSNRRQDGLWHSYNILESDRDAEEMKVSSLQLMLEGQVAILSSGLLSVEEGVELLEKLPSSALRSKRHPTYLLYPDRDLATFDEKNRIPEEALPLKEVFTDGEDALAYRDAAGVWRFDQSLVNGYALSDRLERMKGVSDQDQNRIRDLYEKVFAHHAFTGRSGSMFGYEGLGCVYWHMVSKLMLAAQEVASKACGNLEDASLKQRAAAAYYGVQSGLGFRQTPEQYGAFPAEPYSHSQGERGAQQPGLTGQVKEGLLCRLGELGVDYSGGCLAFKPHLLRAAEFEGISGANSNEVLTPGEIRFTYARVPVVYRREDRSSDFHAVVTLTVGEVLEFPGAELDRDTTERVLSPDGGIREIEIVIPSSYLIS